MQKQKARNLIAQKAQHAAMGPRKYTA